MFHFDSFMQNDVLIFHSKLNVSIVGRGRKKVKLKIFSQFNALVPVSGFLIFQFTHIYLHTFIKVQEETFFLDLTMENS